MDTIINTKAIWMKPGAVEMVCIVGNAAIAVGLGSHILFVNLKTSTESHYLANSTQAGNGVACIAGHKLFPILAFAERCLNPRIVLISYPSFAVVSVLEGGDQTQCAYIALCFSESEYLVALTGVPDYSIEVYTWRSKELLCKKPSSILSDQQRLICSPSSTFAVCQYAARRTQMKLWEVYGNIRLSRLIERTIQLELANDELPFCVVFLIDGNLAMVNQKAKVSIVSSSTGQIVQTINANDADPPESADYIPFIFYCKGGLFVSAPEGQVKFYRKQKGTWNLLWATQSDAPFEQLVHYSSSEGLLGVTTDGIIMRTVLDNDVRNVEFRILKDLDIGYDYGGICGPHKQMAGIKNDGSIRLMKLDSGAAGNTTPVSLLQCIARHPLLPLLVMGTANGTLKVIVVTKEQVKEVASLRLSRHSIERVKFDIVDGDFCAALDKARNLSILAIGPSFELSLIQVLKNHPTLHDLFFWCSPEEVLFVEPIRCTEGIGYKQLEFIVKQHTADAATSTTLAAPHEYTQMLPRRSQAALFLYAHRIRSNVIDILELRRSGGILSVVIEKTISTPQTVLHLELGVDERYLYVWSIDGKLALYDVQADEKLLCRLNFDGRYNGGIHQVSLDARNELLIVLCHSGLLMVLKLLQSFPRSTARSSCETVKAFEARLSVLEGADSTNLEPVPQNDDTVPWIERNELERGQAKGKVFEPEHAAIFAEFMDIKQHLKELVDRNEIVPPEERFPLQEFNLNTEATETLTQKANEEKNVEKLRLQRFIGSQGTINEKLIESCWATMSKKPVKTRSMFKRSFVENYAMLPSSDLRHYLDKVRVYRETELMASHDALLPWKPTPTYQLESILNRDPDYGNVLDNLARATIKKSYTLSGTTTHRFFDPYHLRYDQLEVVTFEQLYFELICGDMEIEQLRVLFNKNFEKIKTLKEEEMELVLKRNRRARHVQQELVLLAKLMADRSKVEVSDIEDPRYEPDERPETIIYTEDTEVPAAPYISPSVEHLLELERQERERRQQELLADDFKDRALVVMMDGVLEHRWEDEIKKSLPLPQCLEIGKEPQHYNETDIREVKEYEEQREFLYQERLRYRRMLQDEGQELAASLDDQIKRFNTTVAKLTLEKIIVEAAIRQEEMRILRATLYNHSRLVYEANSERLREQIDQTVKYVDLITDMTNEFQEKAADYKNTYETLRTKDRLLDKQFKINFSDTAQSALVDQAYKIFKRRPKTQLRSIVTVSIFQDMAKRIVAKKTAGAHGNLLLPKECTDYLGHCETLDQPSNCPAGMDSSLWQTLIKMRRIKIESEFRLKSCELMLSDTEAAIGAFQREITNKRNILTTFEQSLEQLQNERFEDATNRSVQLVMKRGWIEIEQSGRSIDFAKCVLVHRTDVEDINGIIRRAGAKKLNAMMNAALFRRKIIYQEWEHRALKLQLRDLRDQLATVEKCKITKEVQSWLKMKGMKRTEDLSQVALEKKIRSAVQNEEDLLQELKSSLEDIEQRIAVKRKENKHLDQQTRALNVDVTEQHLQRDTELEQTEQKAAQDRMAAIVERARLVRLVQAQHTHILELGTMLELQRLKTYPTLTASTSVMAHNAHHLLSN